MKYSYVIVFAIIFQSCEKKVEIVGCTDKRALNYNHNATIMKDSCCIVPKYEFKKKVELKVDNSRYKNAKYKFIYKSQNDTTLSIRKYSYTNQVKYLNDFSSFSDDIYYYKSMNIVVSDTIDISTSGYTFPYSTFDIVPEKNIKVIEYIEGYEPSTYFIDINNDLDLKFINPRSNFKYQTKSIAYGGGISFVDDAKIRNYEGFLINIEDRIDFWFKDHPYQIIVDKRIKDKVYRRNIVRN